MEFFDLRNPDGSITGVIKERSLVHRDGDLHGTVHIFIVRESKQDKGYEVLLQMRSIEKDSFPGCYDISSAGHLSAGQTYLQAALRELEEELGIQADEEDLHFMGYHEGFCQEEFYGKPFRNHEISAVYVYQKEIDASQLRLQPEEVESVRWFSFEECLERAQMGDKSYCLFADEMEMLGKYLRSL